MSSAASRRKKSGGGEEGGAYWMDTYGDLVTLLLTFFVLLFAFSSIDAAKWDALVGSFTGVSVMSVSPMSPDVALKKPIDEFGMRSDTEENPDDMDEQDAEAAAQLAIAASNLQALYEHMKGFAEANDINADIVLIADEYTVRMVFNDMVFFRTADATVLEESKPVLDKVIEMFRIAEQEGLYTLLRIEGHTDKRPIATLQYPSNWELSADRALRVNSYIRSTERLDKNKLACVGYGEERPLVDEDTDEAYAQNRRVEFAVETLPQTRSSRSSY